MASPVVRAAGRLVGAIDAGTSSSRFILFDTAGRAVASHAEDFAQLNPQPGWVEHEPETYLSTVRTCITECLRKAGVSKDDVAAVGVANQRETTVAFDVTTGKPLCNAIVWCDNRTTGTVDKLIAKTEKKSATAFLDRSGLPLSTYFSAIKMRWMMDNVPEVEQAVKAGTCRFGTVDSWLMWHLTGKKAFVTDVTNASRYMLMNLAERRWDPVLLDFFGVPEETLPEIRSSSEVYGHFADGPLEGTPIAGCLGDQQAALVGQRCFSAGQSKNTYGTGCFLLVNMGPKVCRSSHGLVSTVGYQLGPDAKPAYALEGSIAIAGVALQWLRDNMKLAESYKEISDLAASVPDTGDVYFVTAFSGLYAPHWRDDARGCIVGMTQYTRREHICRAAMEAVCFQTRDVLDAVVKDAADSFDLKELSVDGGMTKSECMVQTQADLLGVPVVRPKLAEATALGGAAAAGLAVGFWDSVEDYVSKTAPPTEGDGANDVFEPKVDEEERERRLARWHKAIEKSLDWAE